VPQFAGNLAVLDALDTGIKCVNGVCVAQPVPAAGDGCGNQVMFNGQIGGGGTPAGDSYVMLAGLLAADELFLDTTKGMCDLPNHANYLGVEFNVLTSAGGVTCGGREPHNDVIDTSYAALAIGLQGFDNSTFTPAFGDGVGPHADLLAAFPYLGPPHS
jgi:hypothetical protein